MEVGKRKQATFFLISIIKLYTRITTVICYLHYLLNLNKFHGIPKVKAYVNLKAKLVVPLATFAIMLENKFRNRSCIQWT